MAKLRMERTSPWRIERMKKNTSYMKIEQRIGATVQDSPRHRKISARTKTCEVTCSAIAHLCTATQEQMTVHKVSFCHNRANANHVIDNSNIGKTSIVSIWSLKCVYLYLRQIHALPIQRNQRKVALNTTRAAFQPITRRHTCGIRSEIRIDSRHRPETTMK
jgi:hypothetical protein